MNIIYHKVYDCLSIWEIWIAREVVFKIGWKTNPIIFFDQNISPISYILSVILNVNFEIELVIITRFVEKPEGVSNVFLTYFDIFSGVDTKSGDWEAPEGGGG